MKGLIIYRSNYGATRSYAGWLGEDTGFPVLTDNEVLTGEIEDAEVIIIGCPVFNSRPLLAGKIVKLWELIGNKDVVLFTTSGAEPGDLKLAEGFCISLPDEIREKIKYFPLGGRMIFSGLKPMHRFFMRLGQMLEKDPAVKASMCRDSDLVDRDSIKPIVEYLEAVKL